MTALCGPRSLVSILMVLMAAFAAIGATQSGPASRPAQSQPTTSQPAMGELTAVVTTAKGEVRIKLLADKAPVTVTNFCNLARRGFFDNTTWHAKSRVVRLAGAPNASQYFTPGYTIKRELHPSLNFRGPGVVAMLKERDSADARSHGSQFFITIKEQDRWTLEFAIFGQVVGGQHVIDSLEPGDALVSVKIEGDPEPLFAKYHKLVTEWNTVLDRPNSGHDSAEMPGSPLLRKAP